MIDCNDLLALALKLRGASLSVNQEVQWRCAISKAYYATFHSCLNLLVEARAPGVSDRSKHALVMEVFCRCTTPELTRVGQKMAELKRLRVEADYRLGSDFKSQLDIERALSAGNFVREMCEKFRAGGISVELIEELKLATDTVRQQSPYYF